MFTLTWLYIKGIPFIERPPDPEQKNNTLLQGMISFSQQKHAFYSYNRLPDHSCFLLTLSMCVVLWRPPQSSDGFSPDSDMISQKFNINPSLVHLAVHPFALRKDFYSPRLSFLFGLLVECKKDSQPFHLFFCLGPVQCMSHDLMFHLKALLDKTYGHRKCCHRD